MGTQAGQKAVEYAVEEEDCAEGEGEAQGGGFVEGLFCLGFGGGSFVALALSLSNVRPQ